MGYGELLRALEEEVREQARVLREAARAERERLAAEGRRLAAAARTEALARAEAEARALGEAARARAALAEDRLILVEKRRLLEALRAEVGARLPGISTPELTCRLLDEALEDDDGSPLAAVVDPGHAAPCRAHLAGRHPGLGGRLELREAAERRGGVALEVGGQLLVDDTLPSRLERAWPRLEVDVARILFGEARGEP